MRDIRVSKMENKNQSLYVEFNEKDEVIKYWIQVDRKEENYQKMKTLREVVKMHFYLKNYSLKEGLEVLKSVVADLEHS